mmetsp:Transcript_34224/g.52491  ORF Transcript_34224/g.52491 Transcript_34224/m.52491 type:complete len:84 (-) Transcript_34224:1061-1312(-)
MGIKSNSVSSMQNILSQQDQNIYTMENGIELTGPANHDENVKDSLHQSSVVQHLNSQSYISNLSSHLQKQPIQSHNTNSYILG